MKPSVYSFHSIPTHRPLGDYFRIKTRGGWSPKLLGRKFLLLCPIIFAVNQQLLLEHTVTASDLEWTPRKCKRIHWKKALSCSGPGLLSGLLFKHLETFRRLWALPIDKILNAEKAFLKLIWKACTFTSKKTLLLRSFSVTWSYVQTGAPV